MAQKFFNRKMFREVQNMSRERMEAFLMEVFDRGYDAGYKAGLEQGRKESASTIRLDLNRLEDELLKIKGIGPIKAAEVKKVVREMLQGIN